MNTAQYRYIAIIGGAILLIVLLLVIYINLKIRYKNALLKHQKHLQEERNTELIQYKQEISDLINEIMEEVDDDDKLEDLVDQCRKYTNELVFNKPVVDALIAYKKNVCENKKISLELNVKQTIPDKLSDGECIGILGNLIDNAIEAAERVEKPWVRISSKIVQGQWLLRVENAKRSAERPLENHLQTTKEDWMNHGVGSKIINRIVKKYKGEMMRTDKGDSFEVLIAMSSI